MKEKQGNIIARIIAFIVGFIFIAMTVVDWWTGFEIILIPAGLGLIIWSIVGGEYKLIK